MTSSLALPAFLLYALLSARRRKAGGMAGVCERRLTVRNQNKTLDMKKRIILFVAFVAAVSVAYAQNEVGRFSLIPRLGVSIANLTNNSVYVAGGGAYEDEELKSRSKAGLLAGFDVDYQATPQVSVSLGLMYSIQGNSYPDYQDAGSEDGTYFGYRDWSTDLHYLNVPIMVNVYVARGFALKAGLQPGFFISGKTKYEETSFVVNEDGSKEYGDVDKMKFDYHGNTFDFSIPVGASYEYMNVILDARYNLGLTNVYKPGVIKSKNQVITVTIGYRFNL